jgi:hypothetical protein
LEPRLGRLDQERERARTQAMDWRHRCEAAEARILVLKTDLTERAAEAQVLEGLLLRDLAPPCDTCLEGDCRACPDLAGRRVLCVGGRHAQAGCFRALVACLNGRLERRDGGVASNNVSSGTYNDHPPRQRLSSSHCCAVRGSAGRTVTDPERSLTSCWRGAAYVGKSAPSGVAPGQCVAGRHPCLSLTQGIQG